MRRGSRRQPADARLELSLPTLTLCRCAPVTSTGVQNKARRVCSRTADACSADICARCYPQTRMSWLPASIVHNLMSKTNEQ
jgi:hypothetical protein